MKFTTLMAALAVASTFAQTVQAREHHHRHGAYHEASGHVFARRYSAGAYRDAAAEAFGWTTESAHQGGYGARPRAWCGWQMRQLVGSDPGPEFNLARNWARWGHAGPAGIGAVVVWAHHVGKIVGQEGDTWIIQSGNDGNRLRTRPLSIARAIAIRWG